MINILYIYKNVSFFQVGSNCWSGGYILFERAIWFSCPSVTQSRDAMHLYIVHTYMPCHIPQLIRNVLKPAWL